MNAAETVATIGVAVVLAGYVAAALVGPNRTGDWRVDLVARWSTLTVGWRQWWADIAVERAKWQTLRDDHAAVSAAWDCPPGGMPATEVPALHHSTPAFPAAVVVGHAWGLAAVHCAERAAMWAELDALARATSLAVEAIPLEVCHA